MRRVHTTFDLLDAHIVTALLRAHGVEAYAFDCGIVRQDWFKTIAFGGFRILADDDTVDAARAILGRWAHGDFALADDDADTCPRCGAASVLHDPQPRRNVFLAMCVLSAFEIAGWAWLAKAWADAIVPAFALQVMAYLSLPWVVLRYFKWRMRCTTCGHRWRRPPQRHAALMRLAADGEAGSR